MVQRFHPQKFIQWLTLTDGSRITITSISPVRPHIKLQVDSLTHPSWNPQNLNQRRLVNSEQLEKFKSRYADYES
jgi:ribosomal protein L31